MDRKPIPTAAELERDILTRMPVLVSALDTPVDLRPVAPGHASPDKARERIAQALASMALALQRVRTAQESEWRNAIRAIRTRDFLENAHPLQERMPVGNAEIPENTHPSGKRTEPAAPSKRRRGAQPGNRNRLRHGRYTAEAKAKLAALREALGRARDIKREAKLLMKIGAGEQR